MTQIEKIKAEIIRRIKVYEHRIDNNNEVEDPDSVDIEQLVKWNAKRDLQICYQDGKADALKDLLSFIESLEKEPKGKTNPLFEECLANVDHAVRKEVHDNIDKMLEKDSNCGKFAIIKSQGLDEAAVKYQIETYGPRVIGGANVLSDEEYMQWNKNKDFIAGAEWMAGQGWISVDEKLPDLDEEVIVLTDEHNTAPIYKIGFGHIVDVERCIDYNGWNHPGVKYWMPCPKIPNND